jgi:PIN domain
VKRFVEVGVRDGVTLEVVPSLDLDPAARLQQPPPADVEILDTCEALQSYAGSSGAVFLVSADYGMRLRAAARDIPIRILGDDDMTGAGT